MIIERLLETMREKIFVPTLNWLSTGLAVGGAADGQRIPKKQETKNMCGADPIGSGPGLAQHVQWHELSWSMIATLHTLKEVAERLRVSRRWLREFIRIHPYYRKADGKKVFTDEDIARLIEALPRPKISPLVGSERASTASPANETELAEVLRLVRGRLRSPRAKKRP